MTPIISSERPIAVISPSGAHDPERLELGLAIAQKAGLNLMLLDGAKARHGYLAGTDEQRTSQIIEAFKNPAYGAVWALRGGFGATRILQHLPFDTFSPKPFIGFSDVVALMPSLYQRGFPVIHGPVVQSLPTTNDASLRHLFSLLRGLPTAPITGEQWCPGDAKGPLVGGNLCMLAALCGTPWQLKAEGALLVLEEVGEQPYRVDRMLQQLRSAGVFDGIQGVVLGEFTNCHNTSTTFSVKEVLCDHISALGLPALGALPIGHGPGNHAFLWGQSARISEGTLHW